MNITDLKTIYESIKQGGLDKMIIRYADIQPLLDTLGNDFNVQEVGRSYQGRPLNKMTMGTGDTRVFFWSQMHGNEPTATAALFDLFNYLKSNAGQEWRQSWEDKLTIQFAPMINPDGAEVHQRYNAQSIDINRDARALQSPEGKILNDLADDFKPHYGFNLHDQVRYYTVTGSINPTTISLLAPAFNEAKEIHQPRLRAMKIGALFNQHLQQAIPGCVGRYDDTYSYRSFGDNFAAKGIATLLIESGFSHNDPNRQVARWLNFMMMVCAIDAIASNKVDELSTEHYDAIPMNNKEGLVDIMLRSVPIADRYEADISINFDPLYQDSLIEEVGDLSNQTGIDERHMADYQLLPAKCFRLDEQTILDEQTYLDLLRRGFSYFSGDSKQLVNESGLPVVVLEDEAELTIPVRETVPHLIFARDNIPELALINGRWINLSD